MTSVKGSKPALPFSLSYETAASLHHVLLANQVHARESGNKTLIESSDNLQKLSNYIAKYLES